MKGGDELRMKSIYLKPIKWSEKFEERKGSYYDYVAEFTVFGEQKIKEVRDTLLNYYQFREIKTNNGVLVFEKDRHVVRIFPVIKISH